ncbi:protein-methionine-sulfoxide reductase catalytic subunit MsrP [Oxynema aestuarii]|jgi:sulfoxide reductase catalytic subunit YedY|uniref:Protein-methionine-sulfoxide reductase catalytic subunit MsrP n=1 Tax=Oxynema aestuarii AP17 TaxID=2064643 RepID=A0A6H1TW68_9CYAN|nr:protein-methionine-sulfoxide reductase catalytic subunit MsrP [Oxynema aestuarii]QIZ70848.1 protein-methionine-sulfoxide reductase catalytic subunit MsrP [Oxynema aestuarii AP17]RMH72142.1 MAG: protein-methionine-sulfoxide reductase catalytic subunit MsrP [Cyanobacteria bacterium J007]
MVLIRILPSWAIPEREVTPPSVYYNRRRFLKGAIAAGIGATLLPTLGCQDRSISSAKLASGTKPLEASPNPQFTDAGRPLTAEAIASRYNNFYEFGGTKSIWQAAQALPTENWKVEVGGLVKNPRTYDLDDLRRKFPQEERIYRFRCVEAWAMVVPWIGFPMRSLLADVEPTDRAKFVRFTSYYDSQVTPGPGFHLGSLPWPYTEGLRIEEMANDLAFFATGIYGHTLPKQHGAPIRMVIPWKYGFKGAKSIVKIEFLAERPATFWNTLVPSEYGFEANVNPNKPHPRWSQATERIVSDGPAISWERQPTLPYNGYGESVAALYTG